MGVMNKNGLHLLWALPLALVPAGFTLGVASIQWCGADGCSSLTRIADPNMSAAILFLIASGFIAAMPWFVVPWSPQRELRFVAALTYAAAVCLAGMVIIAPW